MLPFQVTWSSGEDDRSIETHERAQGALADPPQRQIGPTMSDAIKLQDFDDSGYSPDLPDELAFGDTLDVYPILHAAAKRGMVQEADFRATVGIALDPTYTDRRVFMVFGYDDIRNTLANTELVSQQHHRDGLAYTFGSHSLTVLDPPDHSRYRRIFQRAFLPHVVGAWSKEFVEPVIEGLIDGFAERGRCDLMAEFVRPYPFQIVYRQLRLPPEETEVFYRLSMALTLYSVDFPHAREAHDKLGAFFQALIDERRQNPGTDLISVLATTELDGEFLPDPVLLSFCRQLMNAAGDTTYRSTGCMMMALLSERPDQLEMLKKDRSLVPKAVEETLRWEGPVNMTVRTAKKDLELRGVKIPEGSLIQVITGIANRDPELYPDPDKFDLMRTQTRPHIAFAAGPHVCLGQHLARLEMARALNILLDRLPKLRLDPDQPKPEIRGGMFRRPRHLFVRFD
jgi:cytochrome P450